MKTRYMNGNTPLSEKNKSRATHSIDMKDEDYYNYRNSSFFTDGRVKTAEELAEMKEANAALEKSRKLQALREACERYQIHPGKCNSNFFSLISTVQGVAKATGTEIPSKVKECIDWLDSLWLLHNTREEAEDYDNHDFSEAGQIPHGFDVIRTEAEAS